MIHTSGLNINTDSNGKRYLSGTVSLGSEYAKYGGYNLLYYRRKNDEWRFAGNIDQFGSVHVEAIYVDDQSDVGWRIDPPGIQLGYSPIEDAGSSTSTSSYSSRSLSSSESYSPQENPFSRYFNGIGFGLIILLQVLTAPIWLLGFILHPILVAAKAFRVLVSAVLTIFMVFAAITWDLLMLTVFVVSFRFIRTEKVVVTGYTKELYGWITCGGESAFENFWNLE